jgi:hypothetical protein
MRMRSAICSPQEIQMRLTIFRRTLACLMDKAVLAGGEESAPPEVAYQLAATRRELAFLERSLADLQAAPLSGDASS